MPGSRPPPEGSPFPTPELESVLQRSEEAEPPPEASRSRLSRTFVLLAVVGVIVVGAMVGTLGFGLSGASDDGGGSPPPSRTDTTPPDGRGQVGPRSVDAELVGRGRAACPGDADSRCSYGLYLRGDRTTAEQLGVLEEALGPGSELVQTFARGAIGDARLRHGRGYVYETASGQTVTAYLRSAPVARKCNQDLAVGCVDLVAFEL